MLFRSFAPRANDCRTEQLNSRYPHCAAPTISLFCSGRFVTGKSAIRTSWAYHLLIVFSFTHQCCQCGCAVCACRCMRRLFWFRLGARTLDEQEAAYAGKVCAHLNFFPGLHVHAGGERHCVFECPAFLTFLMPSSIAMFATHAPAFAQILDPCSMFRSTQGKLNWGMCSQYCNTSIVFLMTVMGRCIFSVLDRVITSPFSQHWPMAYRYQDASWLVSCGNQISRMLQYACCSSLMDEISTISIHWAPSALLSA